METKLEHKGYWSPIWQLTTTTVDAAVHCMILGLYISVVFPACLLHVSLCFQLPSLKLMLTSLSLLFKAETFGGETAEQGNHVQEETAENC